MGIRKFIYAMICFRKYNLYTCKKFTLGNVIEEWYVDWVSGTARISDDMGEANGRGIVDLKTSFTKANNKLTTDNRGYKMQFNLKNVFKIRGWIRDRSFFFRKNKKLGWRKSMTACLKFFKDLKTYKELESDTGSCPSFYHFLNTIDSVDKPKNMNFDFSEQKKLEELLMQYKGETSSQEQNGEKDDVDAKPNNMLVDISRQQCENSGSALKDWHYQVLTVVTLDDSGKWIGKPAVTAKQLQQLVKDLGERGIKVMHQPKVPQYTCAADVSNLDDLLGLTPLRRRMAQREFSSRRDSPVMVRLLEEIVAAQDK